MLTDEEVLARYPGFRLDHDNLEYYRGLLERRVLVNRCRSCFRWHHPPRSVCPRCWSRDIAPQEVSGAGTIALVTFLHQGPRAPDVDYALPYPLVSVELVEQAGLRLTSTVVGADRSDIGIGRAVTLTWIVQGGRPVPAFHITPTPPQPRTAP